MIEVQPLFDLVMVKVENKPQERNGLILAEEVQPDIAEGVAVAHGVDVQESIQFEIKLSDGGILFAALDHEAHSYNKDGKRFLFIPAKDIMGTVFKGPGSRFERIQSALGKWVLMEWEEAKETILGGLLVRPVQRAKAHFTGKALKVGDKAQAEIEVGKRYFFEQFSDFKSWSENGKRYAFVPMNAIYCEIPEREADVCLSPDEVASPEFEASMR